jgi:hypothetical protein
MVYNINLFPNFNNPSIKSGRFNSKFKIPVLMGVIKPSMMAIPLSPLLSIWCGMRKKLYANPTRIDPAMMTRILYIFSPCFRKLFPICFIIVKELPKPKIKVFSEMSGNGKGIVMGCFAT